MRLLLCLMIACSTPGSRAPTPTAPAREPEPVVTGEVEAHKFAQVAGVPGCLAIDDDDVFWTTEQGMVWRKSKRAGGRT